MYTVLQYVRLSNVHVYVLDTSVLNNSLQLRSENFILQYYEYSTLYTARYTM